MKPTPINVAEAIFEPFWDPQISGLKQWQIAPGEAHRLKVFQQWCYVQFDWARKPASGPALSMTRRFDVDCTGYDHLLVSVMAPHNALFRVRAETERGCASLEAVFTSEDRKEYAVDLQGAHLIRSVTLEFEPQHDGVAMGWINWLGLQNTQLLPRYLAEWRRFDAAWDGYLQPESYEPTFQPERGLLINREELALLRAEHERSLREHGESPFVRAALKAQAHVPERMIGEYLIREDGRYCRERDQERAIMKHGPAAAIAGLLLKDKALLRLAARYAMAMCFCRSWYDSIICTFPGGPFEYRPFLQTICMYDLSLILDLAGEMFTDLGRDLLRRRIAEEGEGAMDLAFWKYEYIYGNNQAVGFTLGRVWGYLALEPAWPRVRPYTELAMGDLYESLARVILADGGYEEGPSYYTTPMVFAARVLWPYARARGRAFREVVPDALLHGKAMGDLCASTDESTDVIPICDAHAELDPEALAVLAALAPQSQWVNLYHRALAREGGMPTGLLAWQMAKQIPAAGPEPPPFVAMPEMGPLASTRRLGGEWVKLFVQGNRAGAGHAHEDKGSFVLELAGETFAMDPGTCSYGNPLADILKHCERHNMLVPTGLAERPHPANPLPVDVKPRGEGDRERFRATIDAAAGWGPYYRRWVRSWDSPAPDELTITDEYELGRGDGVEFLWNTRLPITIDGRRATITGKRGRAVIEAPEGCTLRVDDLPLLDGTTHHRLAIHCEGTSGTLEVRISLQPSASQLSANTVAEQTPAP